MKYIMSCTRLQREICQQSCGLNTTLYWTEDTRLDTNSEPLIQTFDTADVRILHKLRVFVCHWHETWRKNKRVKLDDVLYVFSQDKTMDLFFSLTELLCCKGIFFFVKKMPLLFLWHFMAWHWLDYKGNSPIEWAFFMALLISFCFLPQRPGKKSFFPL